MTIELDRPGLLASLISPGSQGALGNGRRTPRDWIVDVTFVVLGVASSAIGLAVPDGSRINPPLALHATVGVLAALSLASAWKTCGRSSASPSGWVEFPGGHNGNTMFPRAIAARLVDVLRTVRSLPAGGAVGG
jgi:hypothetical protein